MLPGIVLKDNCFGFRFIYRTFIMLNSHFMVRQNFIQFYLLVSFEHRKICYKSISEMENMYVFLF